MSDGMSEAFKVKLFEEKELDQVVRINWSCLPENHDDSFFLELYYNYPKTFVVATVGDKVVGYMMCRMETGFSELRLGIARKGHIVSVAVLPEYRNKGVGNTLIGKALENMKEYNVKECYLEVRSSNSTAINLYKKNGFKYVKTIDAYYKDGESAYVMARTIP